MEKGTSCFKKCVINSATMDLLKNNFTSLVNDEFVRPEVLNSAQKQDTPQIQVSRFTNTVSKISSENEKKDN